MVFFLGIEMTGSPPCRAEVKNTVSFTSTLPLHIFLAWYSDVDTFTFIAVVCVSYRTAVL
jgi:hypothetical protein